VIPPVTHKEAPILVGPGGLADLFSCVVQLFESKRRCLELDLREPGRQIVVSYLVAPRTHAAANNSRSGPSACRLVYSLKRWQALTRFLDDGELPIDNN
jgi:transposase